MGLGNQSFGVAFSGGGARGFSHIGVVLALEKYNLKADVVAGVSAGSIAAAMYGCGLSGRDMIECFKDHLKFSEYREFRVPTDGLLSLDKFRQKLETWLPITELQGLVIPTVICATDFDNGKSVGFTKGNLAEKVVASCSIPIVFPPVKINGVNYVDGGVLRNLPAWAIRDKCKILLGSNCNPLPRDYKPSSTLLGIAMRTYSLITKSTAINDLKLCDYVVQNPSLSRFKTFGMSEMKKIIVEGYDAACPVIETMLNNK